MMVLTGVDSALRRRLREILPVGRRTRVAVVGDFRYEIYQEAFSRALEILGIEVLRVPATRLLHRSLLTRIERRFAIGPSIASFAKGLLSVVREQRPAITFLYNFPYLPLTAVEAVREVSWLAGYVNDDPFGEHRGRRVWRNLKRQIPYYDNWHVYRKQNVKDFLESGAKSVNILESYYLPWFVPTAFGRPRSRWSYDVVFVGHGERDGRGDYVRALLAAGVRMRIFGSIDGWRSVLGEKDLAEVGPIIPVVGRHYYRLLRRSKVAIVFLSRINRDDYTRRCFEIPAVGCAMVAPRTEKIQSLFSDGREYLGYSSPEELVIRTQWLLENPGFREDLALSGKTKVRLLKSDVVSRAIGWLEDNIAQGVRL